MTRREFAKDSLAYLLSAANRASGGYRSALGFMAEPVGVCRNRMEADHRNHHADDIEAGVAVWVEETARLIDKYAQFSCVIFHDDCSFNRKRRKFLSATHAETFPRIQVVPVFRPSPTSMIPYSLSLCNGASAGASSHNSTFLMEGGGPTEHRGGRIANRGGAFLRRGG